MIAADADISIIFAIDFHFHVCRRHYYCHYAIDTLSPAAIACCHAIFNSLFLDADTPDTMLDFTPFYCRHFAAPALRCHFSSFTRFRLTFSDYISYAIFATLFLSLISTL
jgi:hypothetical protein